MQKIILILMLMISATLALEIEEYDETYKNLRKQPKGFVGIEYARNHIFQAEGDFESESTKIKFGTGYFGRWSHQGYVQFYNSTDSFFHHGSVTGEGIEVGWDAISTYRLSSLVYPYYRLGLSYGTQYAKNTSNEGVGSLIGEIGIGFNFHIITHLDVLVGFDYSNRIFAKYDNSKRLKSSTKFLEDHAYKPYIGININF